MSSVFSQQTMICLHLVLLGEPQVVVGFQQLNVLGQLVDGDRRVAHHSCRGSQHQRKQGKGSEVRPDNKHEHRSAALLIGKKKRRR